MREFGVTSKENIIEVFELPPDLLTNVFNSVSKRALSEKCVVGIDEAGRGPVIGPLVYCAFFCPFTEVNSLKEKFKCADSKTLSEEARENIRKELNDAAEDHGFGHALGLLSPQLISRSMLRREKLNLNEMSHRTVEHLIDLLLKKGISIKEIQIDTVGPVSTYQNRLERKFPRIKITVAEKADALFPAVSAASIFAKVCRDSFIKSKNCGSGYPNDPVTKSFLNDSVDKIFGFPNYVRFSWSTVQQILLKKALIVKWEDDAVESSDVGGGKQTKKKVRLKRPHDCMDLSTFLKKTPRKSFFEEASLKYITLPQS